MGVLLLALLQFPPRPLCLLPACAAITSVALTVPSSASGSTLPHVQAVVTPISQAQSQTRGEILSPALTNLGTTGVEDPDKRVHSDARFSNCSA